MGVLNCEDSACRQESYSRFMDKFRVNENIIVVLLNYSMYQQNKLINEITGKNYLEAILEEDQIESVNFSLLIRSVSEFYYLSQKMFDFELLKKGSSEIDWRDLFYYPDTSPIDMVP